MKRVFLFLATNFAILMVLSVSLRLLGVDSLLDKQSIALNINFLLVLAAVFGMGARSFLWPYRSGQAKRLAGARVIDKSANQNEAWLLDSVYRQAGTAAIGRPEVAIYAAPDPNAFATGMKKNNEPTWRAARK